MCIPKRILLSALLGGAIGSALVAQSPDTIRWKELTYLKQSEAWLGSENAAGLHRLYVDRLSAAEVYADKQNGKFVNYYQSDNCLAFGAKVESFYRLTPRIVFYGEMEYRNFSGKHMGGSYFIHPQETPFDIVEYTDDNRGDKKLEHYHLTGAVSADLSRKVTLGAKVDYTTANYAKQKDLRHVNDLLDMYVTAGIVYRPNSRLTLGADYYYRRSIEGLLLDMYGTTDKVYRSLISYGAFYGTVEQFGENGYTKENEEKPLFNEYHGGALQVGWNITSRLRFFSELAYKSRSGYYGKKSPSTVVYSTHSADIWSYSGALSLTQGNNLHALHMNFRQEVLNNLENIYRYDNEGGGKTNVGYYGTLDTTDKTTRSAEAEYIGHFGVKEGYPTWSVSGSFSYDSREVTASVYPYYRKQNLHTTAFRLSGERNLHRGRNLYSIRVAGSYASGGGDLSKDGTYATPSESQTAPRSMETYLQREFEYLTCKRAGVEVGFKYARPIAKGALRGFTALNYTLTKAFDTTYLEGDQQHRVVWSIGCVF